MVASLFNLVWYNFGFSVMVASLFNLVVSIYIKISSGIETNFILFSAEKSKTLFSTTNLLFK